MKIKNKLTYSIGSLFVVIILLGLFSVSYIIKMKQDTENILVDNYNSVKYAQQMQDALNNYLQDSNSILAFEKSMKLQEDNITEPYEKQVTESLVNQYNLYKKNPDQTNFVLLNKSINTIILINISSISRKAEVAKTTANSAMLWIVVLSVFSAIVAMVMLVRFPKSFTRPIKELTEGIISVSNQNYDSRLNFDKDSEFGEVAISFNSMAEQIATFKESSLTKIIATKLYLELIINSIDEPIICLDNQKNVLFVNNEAIKILNIDYDKIINQSALDISLKNDLFRRLIRELDSDLVKDEPLKIYSNNKESYFQVRYVTTTNNTGTVILLSNITKYKELDNAKTNFISIISHELKTPVSAIMMSLKLLEDKRIGEMNEEQLSLSKSIRENSDRLLIIIGELLKMTQVETGKLQLNPKVTKPIELINYAVNATRVLADKFGCNIEIEYPDKLPKLFVDSEKIAWVVTNLLSNAIHYSNENARIIVGARQVDKNIEIYIQDFGKGIDSRYHQSIFDRYFRVPGTKVKGSGLGLAISKDFIEAHGGTIRVESEVGKGSKFIASLSIP
ncbi:MAG: two-component system sensor histidine kinase [Bacteroidetes bacterium]|nr:two-component system sensor histidine kinase [Bacteroidota bacterium]